MNTEKFKKRKCAKSGCSGKLNLTHDHNGIDIMRCDKCHNFIFKDDFDIIVKQEDIRDDVVINLEGLNRI